MGITRCPKRGPLDHGDRVREEDTSPNHPYSGQRGPTKSAGLGVQVFLGPRRAATTAHATRLGALFAASLARETPETGAPGIRDRLNALTEAGFENTGVAPLKASSATPERCIGHRRNDWRFTVRRLDVGAWALRAPTSHASSLRRDARALMHQRQTH